MKLNENIGTVYQDDAKFLERVQEDRKEIQKQNAALTNTIVEIQKTVAEKEAEIQELKEAILLEKKTTERLIDDNEMLRTINKTMELLPSQVQEAKRFKQMQNSKTEEEMKREKVSNSIKNAASAFGFNAEPK